MSSHRSINSLEDYDLWLGMLWAALQDSFPGFIPKYQSQVANTLKEMRSQHLGDEYINQIEKNLIYGCEGTHQICEAIARFLVLGEPRLGPEVEILAYVESWRFKALPVVGRHLAFLRSGCSGCQVHPDHARYQKLRTLRVSGPFDRYFDEMEFCYKFYQGSCIVAGLTAASILRAEDLSALASTLTVEDVSNRTWHLICARSSAWWQLGIGGVILPEGAASSGR
jgi:hypothetical protein